MRNKDIRHNNGKNELPIYLHLHILLEHTPNLHTCVKPLCYKPEDRGFDTR
jgi:hypothetical protein